MFPVRLPFLQLLMYFTLLNESQYKFQVINNDMNLSSIMVVKTVFKMV